MSKKNLRLSYKEYQIIKHALQQYTQREDATSGDLQAEQRLLNRVNSEVENIKERYAIR
ncbi:DNA strand exchange inhibitor protein [Bacillus sp. Marseille-P3800]|uniref:DNA strand exchange inhibitor protein n=1 Tax=Bacillus sp. Marseille-P3800 TaxID=2014782 RepID=UPI000C06C212|nr:DNA strand exchange inhibitor protein [Bacillus sp. Marseille-P3800]